ncbi:MAG TPA: ribokinase [Gemmataceae bacterium]|jgi:ribokinase|nr:ribokinase [Gemmataceae bacterium]
MGKTPRVVVVGSLVMDFVASASVLPKPGETVLGAHFGMYPGGKGANQAVQAARLGAEVYLIGRVGLDPLGDQLLDNLQKDGVNTEFITRDPEAGTAACCIHVDQQGRNAIVIVPQANALLTTGHIDAAKSVLESAQVVLAQLEVPLLTVQHAFELARAAGITTILNPAPAQPLPAGIFRNSTFLTPNEPEMEALSGLVQGSGSGWEGRSAEKLREQGATHVVITLAERGCYARSSQGELLVPSFAVKTIDTTAAGDAFNGALAVALTEKMEFAKALRFANAAGALATTSRGAQPSLPLRGDVEKLMEASPAGIAR